MNFKFDVEQRIVGKVHALLADLEMVAASH
jgi:hypothetical protein